VRREIGAAVSVACLALQACSWSSIPDQTLPDAERAALLDLFAATNGDRWTRRDWWQTPGKECSWHGVVCGRIHGRTHVVRVELAHNNLRGTIPASLARLMRLAALWLSGNALSGPLPTVLLARLDRAALQVGGYAEQLSSVRELSVRHRHTEFVCNEREYRVRADAATGRSRERCNTENPIGPTWWQYRSSYTGGNVDRLFRLVETGGFDRLFPEYSDHQIHTEFAILSVEYRDTSTRTVSDSGGVAPVRTPPTGERSPSRAAHSSSTGTPRTAARRRRPSTMTASRTSITARAARLRSSGMRTAGAG